MIDPPLHRPRRLRRTPALRSLVRETHLSADHLMMPMFVVPGRDIRTEIPSMPGIYHHSIDQLAAEVTRLSKAGVRHVILFGIPEHKDATGSDSLRDDGIVQQAIRAIRSADVGMHITTDVCLCEYTDHGHCGVPAGQSVDNDQTLPILQAQAVSHVAAGADMVAPSGMMDGTVGALRSALDLEGFTDIAIMGYSVKYASAYYGPFRDAAGSTPQYGDRRSYQMDPANRREALREAFLDIAEGADIVMVKPALAYLDIIRELRDAVDLPVACYNVSGEYSMIMAAAAAGYIDGDAVMMESLLSMRRAGSDLILTYFAERAANLLARS